MPKSDQPFACPECDNAYVQKCNYQTHYYEVHLGRRYKCPSCFQLFIRSEQCRLHIKRDHSDMPDLKPEIHWLDAVKGELCVCVCVAITP